MQRPWQPMMATPIAREASSFLQGGVAEPAQHGRAMHSPGDSTVMTAMPMRTWIAALMMAILFALAPAVAQQAPQPQPPATPPATEEAQPPPAASNGAKPTPATEVPPQIAQQIAHFSTSIDAAEKSIERIRDCRPDILVKGGDWPIDRIVGNREVTGWGGRVESIPFIHQKSTTALLEKIRRL